MRVVRRRRSKKKIIRGILILSIIAIGSLVGIFFVGKVLKTEIIDPIIKETKKSEPNKPKEEVHKLSMVMAGDVLIHSTLYQDAYNASTDTYDFKKHFEHIKPIVSKFDLAFYNQETILGGTELGLSTYPMFNSPYEVGDAMLDAGFNMVSLANNHTLDRGEKAVLNSAKYWKSKSNILTAGSYATKEERDEIRIMEKNNIKYALLAYTTTTNGLYAPYGKEYFVNVYSDEQAKKDIEAIRDKVDVLFVSMHWGEEYTDEPVWSQKEIAKYLASLNVDVIIGTHPHVIEPVVWIDNTLVFYSLGNFISAQTNEGNYARLVGLMPSLDITKTVKDGVSEIKIDNINNQLIYNYYQNYRNFKLIPFSMMESKYNYNYKSLYNTYSAVVKMYDDTMPVTALE